MKIILPIFLAFFFTSIQAQQTYWVSFTNKGEKKYDLKKPEVFMSAKALERRLKFNIPIKRSDLPVSSEYLKIVENVGIEILHSSKWLNGSMISSSDVSKIDLLKTYPFVKEVISLSTVDNSVFQNKFQVSEEKITRNKKRVNYGESANQVIMILGNYLHDLNYLGTGIDIAVMDNGFPSVDTNRFYQEAFLDGRINAGYDFVNNNDTLFDSENGNHGNYVISTMVSFIEDTLVGTAPLANYTLFSTEDNNFEGLQEEYNWALAAEMADDSLGTNVIISTSLGYSNGFNNSADEHTYEDMDGNTTPITIAADLAASKGMLVINSAGNEGNNSWYHITAPSDGDSVLAVGAVTARREVVGFSSRGPSYDNRIKPNVCAQGSNAMGVNVFGEVVSINGTSFSCPITSGAAACLWEAFPNKTNMEIFYAIERSAHVFNSPDADFGYGIPNFKKAYEFLEEKEFSEQLLVHPNPINSNFIQFSYPKEMKNKLVQLKLYDLNGKLIFQKSLLAEIYVEKIEIPEYLNKGIFHLTLESDKTFNKTKFVKL